MKLSALVKALEEAHSGLGIPVRRDRGSFRGGRCTIDGSDVMVLNKLHPLEAHLVALAESLRTLPHEQLYLRPAVRAALEDAWAARSAAVLELEGVDEE
ncbi:MAG: hypothetical protein R3284_01740 [Rubricoccaceae bacterium]|nr:hypothetical protein [Rubricoccaceae bacterium]